MSGSGAAPEGRGTVPDALDAALETLGDAVGRAVAAYDDLAALGEQVEDEWTYVTDLSSSWRARLQAEVEARGTEAVSEEVRSAVDHAITEIGAIRDPHRGIDWLSTFPQVVLLALGATP